MANTETNTSRLCLVTPSGIAADAFIPVLEEALAGGDVASLIITTNGDDLGRLAEALVPVAQARDVAALIHNDAAIAARTGADGVHIDDRGDDLVARVASLHPVRIAGIGNLMSRHEAMSAGDADPDYVFFGRLDGDTEAMIFDKAFALAEWWAALFRIPAIVMGGTDLASAKQAGNAGIEFVGLRRAVWEHSEGPGAAVATANRLLMQAKDTVT